MLRQMLLGCLAVAACLFATLPTADPRAQTRDPDQFIIGVLRADSVIVPFAQYRKGKWLNPWPKPKAYPEEPDNDEPNTLADLPKAWFERYVKQSSNWFLPSVMESGPNQSGEVVKTSKIVKADSHCTEVWGLVSDYPGRSDEGGYHEKRSVVVSADRKVSPMIELHTSPGWSRVRDFIAVDFPRAETVGLSKMAEYGIPIDLPAAEERNQVPLSLRRLYSGHSGIDGRLIYYFEARKEYPKPRFANDEGCNNYSVSSGWIIQDQQGHLQLIDSQAYLTDCDGKEGGMTIPFGILVADGRTFVIVEELGYESESYVILELDDSGIHHVLETSASGC